MTQDSSSNVRLSIFSKSDLSVVFIRGWTELFVSKQNFVSAINVSTKTLIANKCVSKKKLDFHRTEETDLHDQSKKEKIGILQK